MISLHECIRELRRNLGYKDDESGVCTFYAEKGIDAWLVSADEYHYVFMKRIAFIQQNYHALPMMIKNVYESIQERSLKERKQKPHPAKIDIKISEFEQQVLDVNAFIQQGELYFSPSNYSEFFGRFLSQHHSSSISYFAEPELLKKRGGRSQINVLTRVFTRDDLIFYMSFLIKMAELAHDDFALSLDSEDHRIGLCFNKTKNYWAVIDINEPNLAPFFGKMIKFKNELVKNENLAIELADCVIDSFEDEIEKNKVKIGIVVKLFARGQDCLKLQLLCNLLHQDHSFINFREINSESAQVILKRNKTLAWMAACEGDVDSLERIIKALKETSVNLNSIFNNTDRVGRTPAYIAAQNGHAAVIKILATAGVDLNFNKDGATPAFVAAQCNQAEVLKALADAKANLDIPNSKGATPTIIAVLEGHVAALKALAQGGANFDIGLANGIAPVYFAAQNGDVEILKILLEGGAKPNSLSNGYTPIFVAAFSGHVEIIEVLIKAGVGVNERIMGTNLIHLVVNKGYLDILKMLIDNGAEVDTRDVNGSTPAALAVQEGKIEALRILIDGGANLNIPNYDGATPVFIAAYLGNLEMFKMLVKAKANIHIPRIDGITPSYAAAMSGHVEILKILAENNVDLTDVIYSIDVSLIKNSQYVIKFFEEWKRGGISSNFPHQVSNLPNFYQQNNIRRDKNSDQNSHEHISKKFKL